MENINFMELSLEEQVEILKNMGEYPEIMIIGLAESMGRMCSRNQKIYIPVPKENRNSLACKAMVSPETGKMQGIIIAFTSKEAYKNSPADLQAGTRLKKFSLSEILVDYVLNVEDIAGLYMNIDQHEKGLFIDRKCIMLAI